MSTSPLKQRKSTRKYTSGETEITTKPALLTGMIVSKNGSDVAMTLKDGNNTKFICDKLEGDIPRSIMFGDGMHFDDSIKLTLTGSDPAINWYKLDETSGSAAEDSGSEANADLTLTNMEAGDWVGGKIGGCLEFGGVDEYAASVGPLIVNSDEPFSICFWLNCATPATMDGIFQAADGLLKCWQDHFWFRFFCGRAGSRAVYVYYNDPAGVFTASTWYHIAITWDGSQTSAGTAIYINSDRKSLGVILDNFNGVKVWSDAFHVGRSAGYLDGKIDDFRVYDVELTEDDVDYIYNGGEGRGDDYSMADILCLYKE